MKYCFFPGYRQFFLDALPMTGTAGSLEVMSDLIMNKEVTGEEADMWLTTIPFIKKPTVEMLTAVKVIQWSFLPLYL